MNVKCKYSKYQIPNKGKFFFFIGKININVNFSIKKNPFESVISNQRGLKKTIIEVIKNAQ